MGYYTRYKLIVEVFDKAKVSNKACVNADHIKAPKGALFSMPHIYYTRKDDNK